MKRDVFVAQSDGPARNAGRFAMPTGMRLRELVGAVANLYNIQDFADGTRMSTDADEYDLFAWHLQRLPGTARLAQVPRPGVILAAHRGADPQDAWASALQLRRSLEQDASWEQRFHDFLDTPAARWPAVPLCEQDLLVSHDADDEGVVAQIVDELRAASLTCVALERPGAHTSPAADGWRRELARSALLVSVIGPAGVDKPVLHREAGAAWALRRAIVPALIGVPPGALSYLLSSYQVRTVDTPEARTALASELAEFMVGAAGGMAD
ncbi:TIR domain-containing protein [Cellulomonas terrae]|uniref:TIR domain-containing protein n=1 Tax=Cellulomonas terrae TaxID=311234 RepID=UPI0011BE3D3D|nr:TIR domain-containing protein [Cellulomonas terrae]